jgi:hypothetical protein
VTGPLPAPSATGVRIAGDRYQWLVAWGACVEALRETATGAENPVVSIGVEVDGVGNLDDVVIRRTRPPHAYKQVKYTVDSRTPVNTDYLTEPSPRGGPSILEKIAAAWRELAPSGEPIELAIVSNRLPDPDDPLIAVRDSRTRLLLPKAGVGSARSTIGKARAEWAERTGLTDAELLRLLAVLDFDLGHDTEHLARMVKLTMLVSGLRGDDAGLSAGVNWIEEQVIAGRRELELGDIRDAIEARGLRLEDARTIVSVATLLPDPLADRAVYALDWVDRFDGKDANLKRRPKPPATWGQLQDDIEQIPGHLGSATRLVVTGSMRLAPAFAVGATLRMVTGLDVATMQRGVLWGSDAQYAAPSMPLVTERAIDQGADLAIAFEIATPIGNDVFTFLHEQGVPVRRLVVVGPSGGPRDNAVAGPEDACALAVGIRDAVRREVKGSPRVHLFLAGPMGLVLLIGHRWNRIAPTVVYEDVSGLGYEAAFTVSA